VIALKNQPDGVLLQIIWDYLGVRTELAPADVIIAGGGRDLCVAKEAAKLYLQGLAPWLIVTGGFHTGLQQFEAEAYASEAMKAGVPEKSILKEPRARHLGDNVVFSRQLLAERGIEVRTVIWVHTPIATRRLYATALKQWPKPQPRFLFHHERVAFTAYKKRLGMEDTIPRMLGYVERMSSHVRRGFQITQEIPDTVQHAYATLLARGYAERGLHD
jgi:uncharacterized SAM-binding protein YcdF (DUF218 family)